MKTPHYQQSTERIENAAKLRQSMTEEEVMMWTALRGYRKLGHAFRRQAAVGPYIADFLCRKQKLIVEVDGRHHDQPDQITHDQRRDEWLRMQGYRIIRISAYDVRTKIEDVLKDIDAHLRRNKSVTKEPPPPALCAGPPPPEGGGKSKPTS